MDIQRQLQEIALLPVFFNASEGLPSPSRLLDTSRGPDVLFLQGAVADHVSDTTLTCEGEHWESYEGFHEWLRSVKRLIRHYDHDSLQDVAQLGHIAMAFALTAGEAYNRKRTVSADLSTLKEYIDDIPMRRDSSIAGLTEHMVYEKNKMDVMYAASCVTFCLLRRIFVTHSGRLGLGPSAMRPNDLVVIFRDGNTPFVIRKIDDWYQLVGACYVYGIMDGEAVIHQTSTETTREEVFGIH